MKQKPNPDELISRLHSTATVVFYCHAHALSFLSFLLMFETGQSGPVLFFFSLLFCDYFYSHGLFPNSYSLSILYGL